MRSLYFIYNGKTLFERMISNPDGAVIREKESEYEKNLDNMTSEIPIINLD
jgi:hypothetical protein